MQAWISWRGHLGSTRRAPEVRRVFRGVCGTRNGGGDRLANLQCPHGMGVPAALRLRQPCCFHLYARLPEWGKSDLQCALRLPAESCFSSAPIVHSVAFAVLHASQRVLFRIDLARLPATKILALDAQLLAVLMELFCVRPAVSMQDRYRDFPDLMAWSCRTRRSLS